MDLRCSKLDCEYNNKYACRAKKIDIAKNTICKTYKKDADANQNKINAIKQDMFEVAPDFAHYKHNDRMCVECRADCVFNRNGDCKSNGITVLDQNNVGSCGTFIKE